MVRRRLTDLKCDWLMPNATELSNTKNSEAQRISAGTHSSSYLSLHTDNPRRRVYCTTGSEKSKKYRKRERVVVHTCYHLHKGTTGGSPVPRNHLPSIGKLRYTNNNETTTEKASETSSTLETKNSITNDSIVMGRADAI